MNYRIHLLLLFFIISGCASMLPNSKPIARFDDFKKTWTITSTRWGNDSTNLGRNPSLIRAYIFKDGSVTGHVYVQLQTESLMRPKYALNSAGKRYNITNVHSEISCPTANSCYWKQDIIINVDYIEISKLLGNDNSFKLRVYGKLPPEDIIVLACQYWEVTNEIGKIKKLDFSKDKWFSSRSACTK